MTLDRDTLGIARFQAGAGPCRPLIRDRAGMTLVGRRLP
jgi:hypothetical protein